MTSEWLLNEYNVEDSSFGSVEPLSPVSANELRIPKMHPQSDFVYGLLRDMFSSRLRETGSTRWAPEPKPADPLHDAAQGAGAKMTSLFFLIAN